MGNALSNFLSVTAIAKMRLKEEAMTVVISFASMNVEDMEHAQMESASVMKDIREQIVAYLKFR